LELRPDTFSGQIRPLAARTGLPQRFSVSVGGDLRSANAMAAAAADAHAHAEATRAAATATAEDAAVATAAATKAEAVKQQPRVSQIDESAAGDDDDGTSEFSVPAFSDDSDFDELEGEAARFHAVAADTLATAHTAGARTRAVADALSVRYDKGALAAGMSRTLQIVLHAGLERAGLDLRVCGMALRVATEVEVYSIPLFGSVGAPRMAPPYAASGERASTGELLSLARSERAATDTLAY
jgi:hypothetical protein